MVSFEVISRLPGTMPTVHPSAVLSGDIDLDEGVEVGPHCVLTGPLRVGSGTRLIGNVYLNGPLVLGQRNLIYPFVTIGFAPQHRGCDPSYPGAGVVIGDDNTFRESATVHRATSDQRPTRIGDGNYWMVNAHAGHDCVVGSQCTFANDTLLAGCVEIGDGVTTGGDVAIHQRCRVGRGAMICGTMGTNKDVPPFLMLTGPNIVGSINRIGMRRAGLTQDEIRDVKWVFKTLYRRGLTPQAAIGELRAQADRAIVAETLQFIERSERGLCPGVGEARRGTADFAADLVGRKVSTLP